MVNFDDLHVCISSILHKGEHPVLSVVAKYDWIRGGINVVDTLPLAHIFQCVGACGSIWVLHEAENLLARQHLVTEIQQEGGDTYLRLHTALTDHNVASVNDDRQLVLVRDSVIAAFQVASRHIENNEQNVNSGRA